jgi:tetratricopeptide (TPR) repeat protein
MAARRSDRLLLCALLLCLPLAVTAGQRFAAQRETIDDTAELQLFPDGRALDELSLGHRHLAADVAWLTAIQYYGKHRQGDRRYPLARHLFDVITDADPTFRNAYLFGALILGEAGQLDAAEALLRKGVRADPGSWRLAFELGFFHYAYTRRWADALAAFRRAAAMPQAPEYVVRFAAAAGERAGSLRLAAELWGIVARESANVEVRQIARERLAALRAEPTPH